MQKKRAASGAVVLPLAVRQRTDKKEEKKVEALEVEVSAAERATSSRVLRPTVKAPGMPREDKTAMRRLPPQQPLVLTHSSARELRRALAAGFMQSASGGASRARLPKRAACSAVSASQSRSLLEANAVSGHTDYGYRLEVRRLEEFARPRGLAMVSDQDVDAGMVEYFDEEFLRGADGHRGHKIQAAYMSVHPEFGRYGHRCLPRAHRALRGWNRLAPGFARTPDAFPVWASVAVRLNTKGFRMMGFWVLVAFGTYMRPGELHSLRVRDLLPPAPGISNHWGFLGFLVREQESAIPNKVGEFDNSILWDSPALAWMASVSKELRRGRPNGQNLWPFTASELTKQFRVVTRELRLPDLGLYQLRHSGASWDRLKSMRILAAVKKRGWRTDRSMHRYEKATRVLAEWHKLGQSFRNYCQMCADRLQEMMAENARAKPAKRAAKRVLEDIFSGCGGVTAAATQRGQRSVRTDIVHGDEHDLTKRRVQNRKVFRDTQRPGAGRYTGNAVHLLHHRATRPSASSPRASPTSSVA